MLCLRTSTETSRNDKDDGVSNSNIQFTEQTNSIWDSPEERNKLHSASTTHAAVDGRVFKWSNHKTYNASSTWVVPPSRRVSQVIAVPAFTLRSISLRGFWTMFTLLRERGICLRPDAALGLRWTIFENGVLGNHVISVLLRQMIFICQN